MAGFFQVNQGGKIRFNATTATGQTWTKGQVVCIDSTGKLAKVSSSNIGTSIVFGLGLEQCVSPTTGNVIQNTSVVVAGNPGSILLGLSEVVNDNLSGTGGWVPGNSKVYVDTNANLTYNAPAAAINLSGAQLGVTLKGADSNGQLTFLYRPPVGN